MAQLAMLKENVYRLPQRVIENLRHLLMHEWILRGRIRRVRTLKAWERESHRALPLRFLERGPNFGIAFGRTEPHDDVLRTKNRLQPGPKQNREVEGRQGALSHDHGMNELDRHMLRIRGIRTATKGQKPPSAQEALRHFTASFGQSRRLARKEMLEQLVALEQAFFNLGGKNVGRELRCGRHRSLTDSRQRIADEHIHDSTAPIKGSHEHRA